MKAAAEELPKDPEALKALVEQLKSENEALRNENRTLEEKALRFQDLLFGRKSEKTRLDPNSEDWKQVPLFQAELLAEAKAAAEANNVSGSISSEPGKPKDEQKTCACGHEMHVTGFETSKELERIETTIVHTIKRAKYACRGCGECMKTAPGPFRPFEGALLGTGFTATMLNDRFGHHMPFNRLESKYRGEGLELSRSTLERTAARSAKRLAPLVDLLKQKIKASEVLFTDDTPVTIARAPSSTSGSKKGRMWVYVDREGNHAFDFTRDRKMQQPKSWLDGFKGAMHADAYSGYDSIFESKDVTEIACWAHARRYFKEAEGFDPDIAAEILSRIRDLFAIESAAKEAGLDDDARRDFRREKATPILRDIRARLDRHEVSVLPKSTLGKAIRYAWEPTSMTDAARSRTTRPSGR